MFHRLYLSSPPFTAHTAFTALSNRTARTAFSALSNHTAFSALSNRTAHTAGTADNLFTILFDFWKT